MKNQLQKAEQECQRLGGTMKGGMVMGTIGPLVGMLFALLRTMIDQADRHHRAILAMANEIEKLKRRQGDGGS